MECASWGAEIRSIIITGAIALAALAAFITAMSIGWTRAMRGFVRQMDEADATPPPPPRPRRRFSLVDRDHA